MRDGLWSALQAGQIAFVSSDHSGWPLERKTAASIFEVSAGVPGLETLLSCFYTGLIAQGMDAPALCAAYLSERPARFFGLWPRKGTLAVGADADIAVLSPTEWTYDTSAAHDDLNWSPYDGMRFAKIETSTYLRGKTANDARAPISHPGTGRFCERRAI